MMTSATAGPSAFTGQLKRAIITFNGLLAGIHSLDGAGIMAPQNIEVNGRAVAVKLMDDSYIVNACPQEPADVQQLRQRDGRWCICMGINGQPIRDVMADSRRRNGNAAVIAWDGQKIVGIMTFFPANELAARGAASFRGDAMDWNSVSSWADSQTLAIATCVLCSLAGEEYRRHGIGTAMARATMAWAAERHFRRIGVFGVPSGLLAEHWRDACRPPKQFWEKLGFRMVSRHLSNRAWDTIKRNRLAEIAAAQGNPADAWKLERHPQFIREVESAGIPFAEVDADYSLVHDLSA